MIVRRVKVNRNLNPQEVLDATGRNQYTDKSVVATMPRGEDEETDVYFFQLGRYVSNADLVKEYELRGIEPDPYAQAQVNTDDPDFAKEKPNGTQWKDKDGKWCFVTFNLWNGRRNVSVGRGGGGWLDDWWFAGVRKAVKA
jgi:hypothetical protein